MSESTRIALVFPGQGSQVVGMLGALAEERSVIKETFAEASEALGEDLWALVSQGPQETLNLTQNAQPALLASSVAIWRAIREESSFSIAAVAGHSLGEWSALVCAGALNFQDAVRLVRARGEYMQQAVPLGEGTMAAIIGLEDQEIADVCADAAQGQIVNAVNFNSPGQVVIAGHAAAVERAIELCKEKGAKRALPLAVSAPFHTSLMKPAADRLAEDMEDVVFSMPTIPVIHNVNAATVDSVKALKAIMIEQIYSPVRWVDCVNALAAQGVNQVIECGPGKVLSGLIKRIDRSIAAQASDSPDAIRGIVAIS